MRSFCRKCQRRFAERDGWCLGCWRKHHTSTPVRQSAFDVEKARLEQRMALIVPPPLPDEPRTARSVVIDGVEYEVTWDGT